MGVCYKLTLRQIEPALPPKEHGGSVNLLNFASPTAKRFLENLSFAFYQTRVTSYRSYKGVYMWRMES